MDTINKIHTGTRIRSYLIYLSWCNSIRFWCLINSTKSKMDILWLVNMLQVLPLV